MRIAIVYSSDPVIMDNYIYSIISKNYKNIKAVIRTEGSILHKNSLYLKIKYIITLSLISGFFTTLKNIFHLFTNLVTPSNKVYEVCKSNSIPLFKVSTINSKNCKRLLSKSSLDLIFNQSHHIVSKDILAIPKVGILNRHGALLPKYRGRLSPFWQLLNNESRGGVTFHLLDEKIDNGPIVYQKPIKIESNESFNSLVSKIFTEAGEGFSKSISILEKSDWQQYLLPNDVNLSSYYSSPELRDAFQFLNSKSRYEK